jgi:hypothetical protein
VSLVLVGAAGLALWMLWPQAVFRTQPVLLAVNLTADPEKPKTRGPGQLLAVDVRGLHARAVQLRVYRDDQELVAACSTEPPCRRAGEQLTASVPATRVGRYRVVVYTSDRPLPAPAGSYDQDHATALAQGATAHQAQVVEIW